MTGTNSKSDTENGLSSSVSMIKRFQWWYRTRFKKWHRGPEYADCPSCSGQVYHHQQRETIRYECRNCGWSEYGGSDFTFYIEQKPQQTAWEMYVEFTELIQKHGPDENDPDAYAEWIEEGGIDDVQKGLSKKYDPDELRTALQELEQVSIDE